MPHHLDPSNPTPPPADRSALLLLSLCLALGAILVLGIILHVVL